MKRKNMMSLLMAVTLVTSALAGCGQSAQSTEASAESASVEVASEETEEEAAEEIAESISVVAEENADEITSMDKDSLDGTSQINEAISEYNELNY